MLKHGTSTLVYILYAADDCPLAARRGYYMHYEKERVLGVGIEQLHSQNAFHDRDRRFQASFVISKGA